MNAVSDDSAADDRALRVEFERLWEEAGELWDVHEKSTAFGGYVSADFLAVYEVLAGLRGQLTTVLEWGSGLGVVTIMASRMGFDAYGIESEETLVDLSETLAKEYAPRAQFAHGSFVPDEFEWRPEDSDEVNRTVFDLPGGYESLDMELRDFDLVYAYPWPNELSFFHSIMGECGAPESLFLSYDVREGVQMVRASSRVD